MFNQLYTSPIAVARHRSGPLLKERLAFLAHLASQGYNQRSLQNNARDLLAIARTLALSGRPRKTLALAEVKRKMAKQRCLHYSPYPLAVRWLQFVGRLQPQSAPLTIRARKIKAFADYMEHEAGLSPVTIYHRCWWIRRFFERLRVKGGSLHEITPRRIDMAFQKLLEPGGYSRKTIQSLRQHTAGFLSFCGSAGLVPQRIGGVHSDSAGLLAGIVAAGTVVG